MRAYCFRSLSPRSLTCSFEPSGPPRHEQSSVPCVFLATAVRSLCCNRRCPPVKWRSNLDRNCSASNEGKDVWVVC
jgi:hypothetical protein